LFSDPYDADGAQAGYTIRGVARRRADHGGRSGLHRWEPGGGRAAGGCRAAEGPWNAW